VTTSVRDNDSSQMTFLLDQLERAHAGDAWHGSSRAALLADVTAEEARQVPGEGSHSIWQLVLHMTAWTREVARRVQGEQAAAPDIGDWPPLPPTPDDRAWRATLAALDDAHANLRSAVRSLDPSRLSLYVGDARHAALGTGVTYAQTINGLIQHDAYHTGQVAFAKKLLRASGRSS
jgi:uncharacterized damage-inducible protein DinB